MVKKYKSLQEENPGLSKEWHFVRNLPLTPSDVSLMSGRKVWWKCELTGLPMIKNTIGGFTLNSISVDRIRPGQGYTKDNIRFVLNQVNIFR